MFVSISIDDEISHNCDSVRRLIGAALKRRTRVPPDGGICEEGFLIDVLSKALI